MRLDLIQIYHIAFLCEQHLYVLTGGTLTDITPTDGIAPPGNPDAGEHGDSFYNDDAYGTPRTISAHSGA